ncbi:beta-hexosaminidase [Coprinopsis marcescibilis]|uniref:Beta-hexosaminidase n=1 Tax=Coprinopsis marcescibilis TaxID=230819 RepID=A0A5C3L4X6_COPMA|nr:beta-hexosaminidase [Coprinopsis marcescibilis]
MRTFSLFFFLGLNALTHVYALWPQPKNLETGDIFIKLSPNFDIKFESDGIAEAPSDLIGAIGRTKQHLFEDRHRRLNEKRGECDLEVLQDATSISLLKLSVTKSSIEPIAVEAVKAISTRTEEYSLTLPADGSAATIVAESSLGLLRGLTTFEQLWYWLEEGQNGIVYSHQAPVVITNDKPSFPYRGLLLDTSRNFFPVKDILRTLDTMSMVKMTILHWHVVDSQSFPLEIPGYEEIAKKGAYSLEQRYTTDDVQHIVKYAAERGVDILMEIDTPGHTDSMSGAHPEHIACSKAQPWHDYAAQPPAGQLRISSQKTREWVADLFRNIAQTLPSTMFHTGGDEINMRCYLDDPQSREELAKEGFPVNDAGLNLALDQFTKVTHDALRQVKKTPVVWQEIALEHWLEHLGNDTIVTIWTNSDKAVHAINQGFRVVHAPSNYFYLDCGQGGWLGDWPNGNSWCDPFKTWQRALIFDPLEAIKPHQAHLVLGGQQMLWAEQTTPENMDPVIWPRAAASAEVFWSGALKGSDRTLLTALPRMHDLRFRMVQRGVKAITIQPYWCALHPGGCDA